MDRASAKNGRAWLALLGGGALLAAGVVLARTWLPEWNAGPIAPAEVFEARAAELARQLGADPAATHRPPALASSSTYESATTALGRRGLGWIAASRTGLAVEVERPIVRPRSPFALLLAAFSLDGHLYQLQRITFDPLNPAAMPAGPVLARLAEGLLQAGERLGPGLAAGSRSYLFPIVPSVPRVGGERERRHDYASVTWTPQHTLVQRVPTRAAQEVTREILQLPRILLLFLAGVGVFFGLLARGKIDLVNGALIGLLVVLVAAPDLSQFGVGTLYGLIVAAIMVGQGIWTFVLWSAGESLLRTSREGFTTSLDALRYGRLGPRAGRALLTGLGVGAGIAGLRLAASALAARLPGCWPEAGSPPLSTFGADGSMVRGVQLAAVVAFALGIGARAVPRRWAPFVAILVATVVLALPALHPLPLALAVGVAIVAALVELGRRAGLTALLAAGIASSLLPAAIFAAGHLDWLGGAFAVAGGGAAALLLLGIVGIVRPAEVELGRVTAPAFMLRLEGEERLRYEMELLARMQLGLLPELIPQPPGWEIAARSLLASEAGGDFYDFLGEDVAENGTLWIAAGDVAGHGYSCAIVQAMTVAALSSLIAPGRAPAGVLAEIDRVLRRGGAQRNSTTLALLRLDLATGEALFANAAHPYPLLAAGGEVREIELPGLALGKGPRREYRDLALTVPPGGVLVLASDGLFEAANERVEVYGYGRLPALLRTVARRPAEAIAEALLEDWRRHRGDEEPADDTTIVVIKRQARSAGA